MSSKSKRGWRDPIALGAVLAFLFAAVAVAEGVGDPRIPAGAVAIVENAPGKVATITRAELWRGMEQYAALNGKKNPDEGDVPYYKERALGILLHAIWIQGLANELDVSATPKEIAAQTRELRRQFKSRAEYERYLEQNHSTDAWVDREVMVRIVGGKIMEKVNEGAARPSRNEVDEYYDLVKNEQPPRSKSQIRSQLELRAKEEVVQRYTASYTSLWRSRTFCAPGYQIELCGNSRAGSRSALSMSACHGDARNEARPLACPAPVQQLAPTLPGQVTVMTPRGRPLPQGPQPR